MILFSINNQGVLSAGYGVNITADQLAINNGYITSFGHIEGAYVVLGSYDLILNGEFGTVISEWGTVVNGSAITNMGAIKTAGDWLAVADTLTKHGMISGESI